MDQTPVPEFLRIAPGVDAALAVGRPVVAFETTILSFGLPHPLNAEVAAACEDAARRHGAVPATLAILDGTVRAGLTHDETAFFCSRHADIRKVNLQNFAGVLASGRPGALTVAASLKACAMAGIRVFATGGIGGVHRGFASLPDVSGDLPALARFPVATVCAGAKSILDVPATLEALETLGVPVAGFATRTFPLFHARGSVHALEECFDDVEALADLVRARLALGDGGVLVANPVPAADAVDPAELERWIAKALELAAGAGVTGKKVTPFLLEQLESLSDGRTLRANRSLVLNNADLAARLAVALASGGR